MKQNKKIAITGGIGSGKSTVGKIVEEFGMPIFSCDAIYHELLEEKEFLIGLNSVFPGVVKEDKLDKIALSKIVFNDEFALKRLNDYTHPAIMKRLYSLMDAHDIAFAEVPLLFEGGFEKDFDYVIVVKRSLDERIASVVERDGISKEEVEKRINNQFNYDLADMNKCIFIENDGNKDKLCKKTTDLILKIRDDKV